MFIVFFLQVLSFFSCNHIEYWPDVVTVEIINKLQDCEEENLHYSILKVEENSFKKFKDSLVLPLLDESINTKANYQLFFPVETKHRVKIKVKGFLSYRGHNDWSSGCVGAYYLKVINVLEVENVDTLFDYPINNK